ncbi:MAG: GTP cyclohydrolase [Bacteroidota bacterium]
MNRMNTLRRFGLFALMAAVLTVTGCKKDDDAPDEENEVEVITDVKLVFTNTNNGSDVVEARAQDPDGEGVQALAILDDITLSAGQTYTLTYEIFNNLESPGEDIGLEILEEDDEHQFFFSFSTDAFDNPGGNGNIDNAADAINYNDVDDAGNPVGLSTEWTTSSTALTNGNFTVRLQHQPDVKTSTSDANTGDTDFNLEFVLNIQ